jgi:hypothetical protein
MVDIGQFYDYDLKIRFFFIFYRNGFGFGGIEVGD